MIKKRLIEKIVLLNKKYGLFGKDDRTLLAVSGGIDSMVMFRLMIEIRKISGVELAVGHVDHGLRKDSVKDREFVMSQAVAAGVAFQCARVDVRGYAEKNGLTIEEAGRRERYRLLREFADESGCARIATAHTASDQAETVLMRLIRGTSVFGLSAIMPATGDGIIRPMLSITRKEIARCAGEMKVKYVEDPTNRSSEFLRNKIRHKLLPFLEKNFSPDVEDTLAAVAVDAFEMRDVIDSMVSGIISAGCVFTENSIALTDCRAIPGQILPYVFNRIFTLLTGESGGLYREHLNKLKEIAASGKKTLNYQLPRGVIVTKSGDEIRFFR